MKPVFNQPKAIYLWIYNIKFAYFEIRIIRIKNVHLIFENKFGIEWKFDSYEIIVSLTQLKFNENDIKKIKIEIYSLISLLLFLNKKKTK